MTTVSRPGAPFIPVCLLLALALLAVGCLHVAPASANFGITAFDGAVSASSAGDPFTQAGGHPYDASTTFQLHTTTNSQGQLIPDGGVKDLTVDLPPGFIGDPTSVSTCMGGTIALIDGDCPASSQVGIAEVDISYSGTPITAFRLPIFNMRPLTGDVASFAFAPILLPVYLRASVRSEGDYGVRIRVQDTSQALAILGSKITFWGRPADPSHDDDRGFEASSHLPCSGTPDPACSNSSELLERPLVTNPTSCTASGVGLETRLHATSWEGDFDDASFFSHEPPGYPSPPASWGPEVGTTGCAVVPFDPSISVQPSTDQAETPSGLDFRLDMPTDGLLNPKGIAEAHVKRAEVTLPVGTTLNPSAAEGLGVCLPADYARESATSAPGAGCPNASRIGNVRIDSSLLDEPVEGSLYLAQQDDPKTSAPGAENPFDSLLALYIVARSPERGLVVKLAGEVDPDPKTGQLVTVFDDLPQLPFSSFHLHFREGGRAPLVSPPACGTYATQADFVPWSAADPDNPTPPEIAHTTSQFQVTRGVGGGPCPTGGVPPFRPGLTAGTINNSAGTYSPFNVRLTRNDGEQEFTNFSIKLPPGVTGKLAGVPFCPDSAIAAAKTRTGAEELASPSCPKASEVGRTLVGAGVGSIQTYVPGKLDLAGPYNGSALSVVAITSAKVGPFDVGTVVIRQALKVNPETAEVFVDATGSDPIPHIIRGIPVHARDIRVYVDKPEFVLNPTNCKRTSTASTVLGSGLDFASAIDDNPLTVTSPFQAADCASLGFKPKLSLSLTGGTKRGDNPKFKAVLNARPGDANIGAAQVTLPHSAFLDQSHIKTICTRVQFAAGAGNGAGCPAASVYGYAKAVTPLLDEPLEGPVFLRSSSHNLPDLLVALRSGKINVNLAGRIDSVGDGQIRNTFEAVPDAPVTRFTLTMQGGKKGLLINSANLCKRKNRAAALFTGQNGKLHKFNPVLKAPCSKKAKAKAKKRR